MKENLPRVKKENMDIQKLIENSKKVANMDLSEVMSENGGGRDDIMSETSEYLSRVTKNAAEIITKQMPENEVVDLINSIKANVISQMLLNGDFDAIYFLNHNKVTNQYTHSMIFCVIGALYEEGIL